MNHAGQADAEEIASLREGVRLGKSKALGALFERHRPRLRRMVLLRLDRRAQGRIDASDVIQDAFLEATRRLEAYLEDPRMPFYLWLRFLTAQKLLQLHRRHLGAEVRDAGREISLYRGTMPGATSAALAEQLVSRQSSPSQAAIRVEMKARLQEALDAMDPDDREVLALRQFEGLTNRQAAAVLGLGEAAASQRYVRSLQRLKRAFEALERGQTPRGR
jgi:RNA polymerase sigma-70 factor (ECF subfamily)